MLTAGAANAATPTTVRVSGTALVYEAGSGQANVVFVMLAGAKYTVSDEFPITPGPGCLPVPGNPNRVQCNSAGVTTMRIDTRDATHRQQPDGHRQNTRGGSGATRSNGGSGRDNLSGEGEDDTVRGNDGDDLVDGGAGDDGVRRCRRRRTRRRGRRGPHQRRAGRTRPGDDHTRSQPLIVDADEDQRDDGELNERDTVDENVEDIFGGSGGDMLFGNASVNRIEGFGGERYFLFGFAGDDTLRGGAGFNRIDGGPGADFCETPINPGGVFVNRNP